MDKNKIGLFKLVEGLKPVDASKLAEFEREMTEEAIPEIIKEVEKRQMLAAESRQRWLKDAFYPATSSSKHGAAIPRRF